MQFAFNSLQQVYILLLAHTASKSSRLSSEPGSRLVGRAHFDQVKEGFQRPPGDRSAHAAVVQYHSVEQTDVGQVFIMHGHHVVGWRVSPHQVDDVVVREGIATWRAPCQLCLKKIRWVDRSIDS